jgi:hypothetical protein
LHLLGLLNRLLVAHRCDIGRALWLRVLPARWEAPDVARNSGRGNRRMRKRLILGVCIAILGLWRVRCRYVWRRHEAVLVLQLLRLHRLAGHGCSAGHRLLLLLGRRMLLIRDLTHARGPCPVLVRRVLRSVICGYPLLVVPLGRSGYLVGIIVHGGSCELGWCLVVLGGSLEAWVEVAGLLRLQEGRGGGGRETPGDLGWTDACGRMWGASRDGSALRAWHTRDGGRVEGLGGGQIGGVVSYISA